MRRLRAPDGCPWDREQTLESLRGYVIEETYEVLEAIEEGNADSLREELGDLLLEVVFLAQIAHESGDFGMAEVVEGITDKLVRRHPHVFGPRRAGDAREAIRNWEEIKNSEKSGTPGRNSVLEGVPRALPALLRAARLSAKAGVAGFDWTRRGELVEKVKEELAEFVVAADRGDPAAMEEELGDLLFTVANLGRFHTLDPEAALQAANAKFIRRFRYIEDRLGGRGLTPFEASIEEMEELWNQAKSERPPAPGGDGDPDPA